MPFTELLGLHPDSTVLIDFINSLSNKTLDKTASPCVKSYRDAVYLNYFNLGLSLLFSPEQGYVPTSNLTIDQLKKDKLILDSIYIYNVPPRKTTDTQPKATSSRSAELAFSTYPIVPFVLPILPNLKDKDGKVIIRPSSLEVKSTSSGKDFVGAFGEPDRKGGGAGPSSGSIGIWCEWSKDGVMVEFGGDEAIGPQAWERGKDAMWKIITIFRA